MTKAPYSVHSLPFKVLLTISTMLQSIETIYERVKDDAQGRPLSQFRNTFLEPLVSQGLISIDDFGLVSPTDAGMQAYKLALHEQSQPVPKTLYVPPEGIYRGDELGQTCQRPGAYDFMRHPSIINGVPVPRA